MPVYAFASFVAFTCWIWCPAFILCLVSAIRRTIQEAGGGGEKYALHFTLLAAALFTVIVAALLFS